MTNLGQRASPDQAIRTRAAYAIKRADGAKQYICWHCGQPIGYGEEVIKSWLAAKPSLYVLGAEGLAICHIGCEPTRGQAI